MIKPTRQAFLAYARSRQIDPVRAADQWQAWEDSGWRDGRGFVILNWKGKLLTYSKRGFGMFQKGQHDDDDKRRKQASAVEEMERINREHAERHKKRQQ